LCLSLAEQLGKLTTKLHALVPDERLAVIEEQITDLRNAGIAERALKRMTLRPLSLFQMETACLGAQQTCMCRGPLNHWLLSWTLVRILQHTVFCEEAVYFLRVREVD
jgi:hypothetical protein